MSAMAAAAAAFGACLALAFLTWIASVRRRDASIVDSVWSLMIVGAASTFALLIAEPGVRAVWLLPLAAIWALRLSLHITWRNRGRPEDRRYQAIRTRNEPGYTLKSLYLVFGLQAALAWVVALPLMAALAVDARAGWLDAAGAALLVFGIAWEAVADAQLARFSASQQPGQVLRSGLWRYSRHPNYFGEFCVWWGVWLVALSAGAWWSIVSPLLMSVLLLRVSGVPLLERGMIERRPAYRDYAARTNAFFPGPPRNGASL